MPSIGNEIKLSRTLKRKLTRKREFRIIKISIPTATPTPVYINQGSTTAKPPPIEHCHIHTSPQEQARLLTTTTSFVNHPSFSNSSKRSPATGQRKTNTPDLSEDILKSELQTWALKNNVKGVAVSSLLKLLSRHSCFENIPKDCRSLLKTPRTIKVTSINPGSYCHFPLFQTLLKFINQNPNADKISLQINIDGLPVANSSTQQFWPILAHIVEAPDSRPFVIGLYYGNEKPKSSNQYLEPTITDILNCEAQLKAHIGRELKVSVHSVICDSPARAFVLNVKGHMGYYGCQKCECEGEYFRNRMTFAITPAALRTDATFRNKSNEEHHLGENTEFLRLPIDIVDQFPLDYQHLVCLGATRKLLNLWIKGPVSRFRLPARDVISISQKLLWLKPYFSKDFNRKPRALSHLKHFKATEYRSFLLYTGPIVLQAVLPESHYLHFLTLHVAVRILCSKKLESQYINYASTLLDYFVANFKILYGQENVSYNIHNLLHLARDSHKFGNLDSFSTFKFESYLGKLKGLLRSANRRLEQIHNRIYEHQCALDFSCIATTPTGNENKDILFKEFTISDFLGDNCCILDCGSVIIVSDIVKKDTEYHLSGKLLQFLSDLYNTPCKSSLVGIGIYKEGKSAVVVGSSKVVAKCLAFPSGTEFIVFPLLHTI